MRLVGQGIALLLAFLVALAGVIALLVAIILVQGYSLPPRSYVLVLSHVAHAARPGADEQSGTDEQWGPLIAPRPSAPAMRDIAFDWYNVKPEARASLRQLPIAYAEIPEAGTYDPNTNRITIRQHYLPVFLHEYAHANFDRKPLGDKLGFLVAILRLRGATDSRSRQAKAVAAADLDTALRVAQSGGYYNPVLESYARLAELTGGDLSALPESLRPYYADYLQPGPNHWTLRYGDGTQRETSSSGEASY